MAVTRVAIIGSGRVAEAFAKALYRSGAVIGAVVSRNNQTGPALARVVNSRWSEEYLIPAGTTLALIAVPDSSIADVASRIVAGSGTVVVHTSGSTGLDVFPQTTERAGVIYPLQTFTSGRELDMREIHYFTEANTPETLDEIDALTRRLGTNIHHIDTMKRRVLHLSAVFVSNFVNHMMYAGMSVADREGIDRSVFGPLIHETVQKAVDIGPASAQTGPAIRNDKITIEKHLSMLSYSDDLYNLYRLMSDSIIKQGVKRDNG